MGLPQPSSILLEFSIIQTIQRAWGSSISGNLKVECSLTWTVPTVPAVPGLRSYAPHPRRGLRFLLECPPPRLPQLTREKCRAGNPRPQERTNSLNPKKKEPKSPFQEVFSSLGIGI